MTDRLHHLLSTHSRISRAEALARIGEDWRRLAPAAGRLRDTGWGDRISYSAKVFIPLTRLCRDVCHYCTFATAPRALASPYLSVEDALRIATDGARAGCKEALFTLGDRPEDRYRAARDALAAMEQPSTLAYVGHAAAEVLKSTGLLPHLNPGLMDADDFTALRKVAPSMGIMLETASERLSERGGPHFGSPDKHPAARLAALAAAGKARVPLTSGILIGIGETREERIDALLALRDLHDEYGHIQEVIVQNFRAKPDTLMADCPEPDMDDLAWTVAIARLLLGPDMSIQVPPNLYDGDFGELIDAGINDCGGISPITPDHVNPEAPWPHIDRLAATVARRGKTLVERLTVYPRYIAARAEWIDPGLHARVLALSDGGGLARVGIWAPGIDTDGNADDRRDAAPQAAAIHNGPARQITDRLLAGNSATPTAIATLFEARDASLNHLLRAADEARASQAGDEISYVINRNINYTNICLHHCSFCAFSKGRTHEHLRGKPYMLSLDEIGARVNEAVARGATEVCMQGGIHPKFTGETYLEICRAAKKAEPDIHIHAFSPLEITHGAQTLGISIHEFLTELKAAGLGSLPGTAAEVLDDELRQIMAPGKPDTQAWLDVIRTAHNIGLPTTSTIMFGHIDNYLHWARHLLLLRGLQEETGGLTEFVPLPFVHMEAPMFLKGRARKGPTLRETLLMHAISRLVLGPVIRNIQVSWVKMGAPWAAKCLESGANDLGGTLMNESISRAAGAAHGQEFGPAEMMALAQTVGRQPRQRTTLYGSPAGERLAAE